MDYTILGKKYVSVFFWGGKPNRANKANKTNMSDRANGTNKSNEPNMPDRSNKDNSRQGESVVSRHYITQVCRTLQVGAASRFRSCRSESERNDCTVCNSSFREKCK